MAIRYLLLATHYRQKLNLTDDALKAARQSVDRLKAFAANARNNRDGKGISKLSKKAKSGFVKAMDDDLNMPEALSAVFDFVREANKAGAGMQALKTMLDFDRVLGLRLDEAGQWNTPAKAAPGVKKLILEREKHRKDRDWKRADEIRDALAKKGIIVEDTENGPRWKKA